VWCGVVWWCGFFLPIIEPPQQKLFKVVLVCWLGCGNILFKHGYTIQLIKHLDMSNKYCKHGTMSIQYLVSQTEIYASFVAFSNKQKNMLHLTNGWSESHRLGQKQILEPYASGLPPLITGYAYLKSEPFNLQ
jgi:hypothetical protein